MEPPQEAPRQEETTEELQRRRAFEAFEGYPIHINDVTMVARNLLMRDEPNRAWWAAGDPAYYPLRPGWANSNNMDAVDDNTSYRAEPCPWLDRAIPDPAAFFAARFSLDHAQYTLVNNTNGDADRYRIELYEDVYGMSGVDEDAVQDLFADARSHEELIYNAALAELGPMRNDVWPAFTLDNPTTAAACSVAVGGLVPSSPHVKGKIPPTFMRTFFDPKTTLWNAAPPRPRWRDHLRFNAIMATCVCAVTLPTKYELRFKRRHIMPPETQRVYKRNYNKQVRTPIPAKEMAIHFRPAARPYRCVARVASIQPVGSVRLLMFDMTPGAAGASYLSQGAAYVPGSDVTVCVSMPDVSSAVRYVTVEINMRIFPLRNSVVPQLAEFKHSLIVPAGQTTSEHVVFTGLLFCKAKSLTVSVQGDAKSPMLPAGTVMTVYYAGSRALATPAMQKAMSDIARSAENFLASDETKGRRSNIMPFIGTYLALARTLDPDAVVADAADNAPAAVPGPVRRKKRARAEDAAPQPPPNEDNDGGVHDDGFHVDIPDAGPVEVEVRAVEQPAWSLPNDERVQDLLQAGAWQDAISVAYNLWLDTLPNGAHQLEAYWSRLINWIDMTSMTSVEFIHVGEQEIRRAIRQCRRGRPEPAEWTLTWDVISGSLSQHAMADGIGAIASETQVRALVTPEAAQTTVSMAAAEAWLDDQIAFEIGIMGGDVIPLPDDFFAPSSFTLQDENSLGPF